MAEIEQKESGKGKAKKQKKMTIHVDFTPMVDMNMLLITFFMLCTTLSKPQTMEISMPSKDQVTEAEQNKVKASEAVTIILGENNRVFYYLGEPQYENYESLIESSYEADGIRALLMNRNKEVVQNVKELKAKRMAKEITDEEFDVQLKEAKGAKGAPVVMIKACDGASYKNLIDALDEMQICSISKYAIVDLSEGDQFLLDNYEQKGALSSEIDQEAFKKTKRN